MNLQEKIRLNRRREKYRKILKRIRLRIFNYQHTGRLIQATRIIERIQVIIKPRIR